MTKKNELQIDSVIILYPFHGLSLREQQRNQMIQKNCDSRDVL